MDIISLFRIKSLECEPGKIYRVRNPRLFNRAVFSTHKKDSTESIFPKIEASHGNCVKCISLKGGGGKNPQFETIPPNVGNKNPDPITLSMSYVAKGTLEAIGLEPIETLAPEVGKDYIVQSVENMLPNIRMAYKDNKGEIQTEHYPDAFKSGDILKCIGLDKEGYPEFKSKAVAFQDITLTLGKNALAFGLDQYENPAMKTLRPTVPTESAP